MTEADLAVGYAEPDFVERWVVRHDGRAVLRARTRRLTDGTYSVRWRQGRTVHVSAAGHAFDRKEDADEFARAVREGRLP